MPDKEILDNTFILDIFEKSRKMNIEKGMNIYHLLNRVLESGVKGDIVDAGCFTGRTSAVMGKILEQKNSRKKLYLFDSFEGLPKPEAEDGSVPIKGEFRAEVSQVKDLFNYFNLEEPLIFKGWFKETLPKHLPKKICFAHLDGDLYRSIIDSLEHIYPLLSKGAIVVIDDYCDEFLRMKIQDKLNSNKINMSNGRIYKLQNPFPGVKIACDDFLKDKKESVHMLISGEQAQGCFVKS